MENECDIYWKQLKCSMNNQWNNNGNQSNINEKNMNNHWKIDISKWASQQNKIKKKQKETNEKKSTKHPRSLAISRGLVFGAVWTSSGYCVSQFYRKLQHVQWKRVVQGGCASPLGGCASVLGGVAWSPILRGCFRRFFNFDDLFCRLGGPKGNSGGVVQGCAGNTLVGNTFSTT